jgi:hypothetical protein
MILTHSLNHGLDHFDMKLQSGTLTFILLSLIIEQKLHVVVEVERALAHGPGEL